ncbi:MAG TPA: substrate-binding domain-containing protein [Nitrospira sp.]|nr:substrate-binding domain-containing protein [Nitrospira sp.]
MPAATEVYMRASGWHTPDRFGGIMLARGMTMTISKHSLLILLVTVGLLGSALNASALTGRIVIAGYGPEQAMMQDLARAYEKRHPGTAVDLEWERTVRATKLVKEGEAQIAVTDHPEDALRATPVAWDGIAVIVNFANPLTELSTAQVRGLFGGTITRWSELDGADRPVDVISRTATDNLTIGLQASLGLSDKVVSGTVAKSDQQTLRLVSGRDASISYISLKAALKAQEDGIPIRVLTIDHVEPGEPTVASGEYPLRRPVLLLTPQQAEALTDSFLAFVRSPEGQSLIRTMYVPVPSSHRAEFPAS